MLPTVTPLRSRLILRPFRKDDAFVLEQRMPEMPVAGLTAEVDGCILGYGGVAKIGLRHVVFFHLAGEPGELLRAESPGFLHRLVLAGIAQFDAEARESGDVNELFAGCDQKYPRAAVWLARLGFRRLIHDEMPDDVRKIQKAFNQDMWMRSTA